MSVVHSFFLPIKPNAAQRTRATCRGRFAQVYDDPKYRAWKDQALILLSGISATEDFRSLRDRPIAIHTTIIVKPPKTTKLSNPRGDVDNYLKSLFDAITQSGGWWSDDVQIVECHALKRWAKPNEDEGYDVQIRFLDGVAAK